MRVFFYGLFMDVEILKKAGINAKDIDQAYLLDHKLLIGERASLLPSQGDRSYGLIMSVNDEKLTELYAEESVRDYLPHTLVVYSKDNGAEKVICYLLEEDSLKGSNPVYAKRLFELSSRLKFPDNYLRSIKKFV